MSEEKCSKLKKGFFIFIFGVVMVVVINIARAADGDVPSFIVGNEGLTWAILLFACGAGFIGWFASNKERGILSKFVFWFGAACNVLVWIAYDKSLAVLIGLLILVIVSSLSIKLVETKAP